MESLRMCALVFTTLVMAASVAFVNVRPRYVLEIQLPQQRAYGCDITPGVLSVRGAALTFAGESFGLDDLHANLTRFYDPRPDKVLFIDAAPDVRYEDVLLIIAMARGAGVRVFALGDPGPCTPGAEPMFRLTM